MSQNSNRVSDMVTTSTKTPEQPDHSVPLLDGLLDVTQIPGDLVELVKRNAEASPLLRLPAELRAKIWGYALTYEYIVLQRANCGSRLGKLKGGARSTAHNGRMEKELSALHLSETCRQIYSETATMAYELNIFHIGVIHDMNVSLPHLSQFPALKNAISKVEISEVISVWYNYRKMPLIRKHFPAMTQLSIRIDEVSRASITAAGRGPELDFFVEKLRELEGLNFDIVWMDLHRNLIV
ncbi:hypothetical protein CC86DRAFT_426049 [Ophiobolus disseminans]|uniref:DUF7730 domain-containing protein n=1 Tax=Ophiobolus disseminans TaxID=1469910 RepID=A0A6A6ZKW3_9PLEO|nr:hypothetical protein CC86DRAFT_426049 [Ophiobolus disseminans]